MSLSYQEMEKLLDKMVKDVTRTRRADQSAIDISEIKDILKDMAEKNESSDNQEDSNLHRIDQDLRDTARENKESNKEQKDTEKHGALMDLLKAGQGHGGKSSHGGLRGLAELSGAAIPVIEAFKMITGELDTVGKSYETMVANGSGWSGNMLEMGKNINRAGYGVEEFTRMIAEGSQGVKMAGGPEYLKFAQHTRDINVQLGRMGLSQQDQMTMMSKYADSLRENGEITQIGTVESANRFRDLVLQTEKLSGAFGMTITEFMDAQNELRKSKEVVLNTIGMNSRDIDRASHLIAALERTMGRENATNLVNSAINQQRNLPLTTEMRNFTSMNPAEGQRILDIVTRHLSSNSTDIGARDVEDIRKQLVNAGERVLGRDTNIGSMVASGLIKDQDGALGATTSMYLPAATTSVSTDRETPGSDNISGTQGNEPTRTYESNNEERSRVDAARESVMTTTLDTFQKSLTEFLKDDTQAQENIRMELTKLDEHIATLNNIDDKLAELMKQNHDQIVGVMTASKNIELMTSVLGNLGLGGLLTALAGGTGAAGAAGGGHNNHRGDSGRRGRGGNGPDDTPPTGGGNDRSRRSEVRETRTGVTGTHEEPIISNDNTHSGRPSNDNGPILNQGHPPANNNGTILEEGVPPVRSSSMSRFRNYIKGKASDVGHAVAETARNRVLNTFDNLKAAPAAGLRLPLSKLGLIGTGFAALHGYSDYQSANTEEQSGRITHDEANDKKSQVIGGTVGTIAGGAEGAEIGAAIGSLAGPLGAIAGGFTGGYIGSKYGDKVGEKVGHIGHISSDYISHIYNDYISRIFSEYLTGKPKKDSTDTPRTDNNNQPTPPRNNVREDNTDTLQNKVMSSIKTDVNQDNSLLRNKKDVHDEDKFTNDNTILRTPEHKTENANKIVESSIGMSSTPKMSYMDANWLPSTSFNDIASPQNEGKEDSVNTENSNGNSDMAPPPPAQSPLTANTSDNPVDLLKAIKSSFDQMFDSSNQYNMTMVQLLTQINTNGTQANNLMRNSGQYIG